MESLDDNNLYWVSSVKIKDIPKPSVEGIHLSQTIEGAKNVKDYRFNGKKVFLYEIHLKRELSPYIVDHDIGRWDAKNVSMLLLEDKDIMKNLQEKDVETLKTLASLSNGKSIFVQLLYVSDILNKLGYDSIVYVNEYEEESAGEKSIMLFTNKLIDSAVYKGELE